MDEIARCRNQLASFRIKELKDVLTRLGLPKQGKKQVLMDKIISVLVPPEWPYPKGYKSKTTSVTKEEAAKVIDDIYRKLRGPGAVELASGPKSVALLPGTVKQEVQDEALQFRCPCGGNNLNKDADLIQCDNTDCGVWQHLTCVVIPEKVVEGAQLETPAQFYCESCRISMGDPFCVTQSQPLPATKLTASPAIKMEGAQYSVEKTFVLTKSHLEILHKPNHDLQVWCLLLNDKVPYRMHWPAGPDLRVNSVPVRVTTRTGVQSLGINSRDDGPSVFKCTREGTNTLTLNAYEPRPFDPRPFCIGVRIIRRRTLEQVRSMVPSVSKGEALEDALARVRRSINGGCDAAGDSDSDLEVVSDSVTFSLSCPMSGSRITTAARFKPCTHMGGFDLNTFIELNQRTRKWQCPICMKNYTLKELIIDPFFNRMAQAMKEYGEDVKDVELKADGSWRPRLEGAARSREPWRSVEGTVLVLNGFHERVLGPVKLEEGVSPERTSLKIGLKRTHGQWVVNKARNSNNTSRKVPRQERSFSRSSSATDSNNANGYDEEVSQNQGVTERTADNGVDSHGSGSKSNVVFLPAPPPPQDRIIVLSDSDEESGAPAAGPGPGPPYGVAAKEPAQRAVSSDTMSHQHQQRHQQQHRYPNGSAVQAFRHSSAEEDDAAWEPFMPTYTFLNPDGVPSSDYGLGTQAAEKEVENIMVQDMEQMEDYGTTHYLNDDAELRLLFPSQPARALNAAPAGAATAPAAREEEPLDDSWFELRLGGSNADTDGRRRPLQRLERYSSRDSLANTASVLLGLNNNSGSGACFGMQWDSK